jgi:hypothetical protein
MPLSLALAYLLAQVPVTPKLERVCVLETGTPGAEIISVQTSRARAVLTHSTTGAIELFDLADPAKPRSVRLFPLGLAKGEEVTSVAFAPSGDWFLAAIKAHGPLEPGRALALSCTDGRLLATFPCGVGPDCVTIAKSGGVALLANEAEGFVYAGKRLVSAPGSVTIVRLAEDLAKSVVEQCLLDSATPAPTDGRILEREIDGEGVEIPLESGPDFLEPEVVAFLPDETRALVTLQENNTVAVFALDPPRFERLIPLGTTQHPADLVSDDHFEDKLTLLARREPDGIAVSADGRYFVTADEGDTDEGDTGPNVERTALDKPTGGGRTLSVFEFDSGQLLGDTGPEIDRRAAAAGLYPDKRSPKRGSEPEMVVLFEREGRTYAAVTLERAGALALVDLGDPKHPTVLAVAAAGDQPLKDEPEGLAVFRDPHGEADYLYVANEGTGTLGVFRVSR